MSIVSYTGLKKLRVYEACTETKNMEFEGIICRDIAGVAQSVVSDCTLDDQGLIPSRGKGFFL
jgi:hypothetical protein